MEHDQLVGASGGKSKNKQEDRGAAAADEEQTNSNSNSNNKPENDGVPSRKSRVNFGAEAEVVSFEKNERDVDEDKHIDDGVGVDASPSAESDPVKAANTENDETF